MRAVEACDVPPPRQLGYFFPERYLDRCFRNLCFYGFPRIVSDPLCFQIAVPIHALNMQLGYFFPEWYLHYFLRFACCLRSFFWAASLTKSVCGIDFNELYDDSFVTWCNSVTFHAKEKATTLLGPNSVTFPPNGICVIFCNYLISFGEEFVFRWHFGNFCFPLAFWQFRFHKHQTMSDLILSLKHCLPLDHGSDRHETLPKCVTGNSRHLASRNDERKGNDNDNNDGLERSF